MTTTLVVAETHARLLRRVGRGLAPTFLQTVGQSPNIVVRSSRELEALTLDHRFAVAGFRAPA